MSYGTHVVVRLSLVATLLRLLGVTIYTTTHTRGSRSLHCIRWLRYKTQKKHTCSTLVEPH